MISHGTAGAPRTYRELLLEHHAATPLRTPVLIAGSDVGPLELDGPAVVGDALTKAGVRPVDMLPREALGSHNVDGAQINRYGTVITLGVLGWSFDVRRSLIAAFRLTAFGGQLVCIEPSNNCSSDTFYQITPMLLQRFAEANDLPMTANVLFTRGVPEQSSVGIFFAAKKMAGSTWERMPLLNPIL